MQPVQINSTSSYNYFTLGGFVLDNIATGMNTTSSLSTIRGFERTQFHGNNLYYGNIELRLPIVNVDDIPWVDIPYIEAVVIQWTTFIDYGYIWNGSYFHGEKYFKEMYSTVGTGFTFLFKEVANFIIRLQLTLPLNPYDNDKLGELSPYAKNRFQGPAIEFYSTQYF